MQLNKKIEINELIPSLTFPKTQRNDNIVAFGELLILDPTGDTIFKVKGFILREKQFNPNKEPVVTVDAPAFKSGANYMKSFIIEDKNLYFKVCEEFVNKFYSETESQISGPSLAEKEEGMPF